MSGKWIELDNKNSEVTQAQKSQVLTDMWIIASIYKNVYLNKFECL